MCKISKNLKLCSCAQHATTLTHYWILRKQSYPLITSIGEILPPADIDERIDSVNRRLLEELLNAGNCFDVEMKLTYGDILELHFTLPEGSKDKIDLIAYAFTFSNGKWIPSEYEPFGYSQPVQQGKIRDAFVNS